MICYDDEYLHLVLATTYSKEKRMYIIYYLNPSLKKDVSYRNLKEAVVEDLVEGFIILNNINYNENEKRFLLRVFRNQKPIIFNNNLIKLC